MGVHSKAESTTGTTLRIARKPHNRGRYYYNREELRVPGWLLGLVGVHAGDRVRIEVWQGMLIGIPLPRRQQERPIVRL
jgi:hypothetical protein